MKKVYILLYVALYIILLSSFASAEITIDQVKVYNNNERVTDADSSGGDITAQPLDTLEFIVYIKNTENTTVQGKLYGKIVGIDNNDDMIEEQAWYDIIKDDTKSKILTFSLPAEIPTDTYDMTLKVSFRYPNTTETTTTITYNIEVRQTTAKAIDLTLSFNNLTTVCGQIISGMNSCFGYINKSTACQDLLSTTENERGTYKSNADTCSTNLAACNTDKAACISDKDACNQLKATMITLTDSQKQQDLAVSKAKNDTMLMVGGIALLIGVIVYFQFQRKKGQTLAGAGEEYYLKT